MPDVRDLLHDAAATPAAPPDPDRLWQRGRRRLRWQWAGGATAATLAIAAVLAVVLPLTPATLPVVEDAPPASIERRIPLPDGWQEVGFADARFGFPGDWTVDFAMGVVVPCDRASMVWVGVDGQTQLDCGFGDTVFSDAAQQPAAILLAGLASEWDALATQPASAEVTDEVVNGFGVRRVRVNEVEARGCDDDGSCVDAGRTVDTIVVEELDLVLQLHQRGQDDLADRILATIERLPGTEEAPAAGERRTPLPDGWQEVRVGSASFGVPGEWAIDVRQPGDDAPCPNTIGDQPTAFVAPEGFAASEPTCPLPASSAPALIAVPGSLADRSTWIIPAAATLAWERTTVAGYDALVVGSMWLVDELDLLVRFENDAGGEVVEQILATVEPVAPVVPVLGDRTRPLPEGWQEVRVSDASFGVPGDWQGPTTVYDTQEISCAAGDVVYLVEGNPRVACDGVEGEDIFADDQLGTNRDGPGVILLAGDARAFDPPRQGTIVTEVDGLEVERSDVESMAMRLCSGEPCPSTQFTLTSVVAREANLALAFHHRAVGDVDAVIATIELLRPQEVDLGGGSPGFDTPDSPDEGPAEPDCPYVDGANANVDVAGSSLQWNGATYGEDVEHGLTTADLGPQVGLTRCDLGRIPVQGDYVPQDGDGVALPTGLPIHRLDGLEDELRLAVAGTGDGGGAGGSAAGGLQVFTVRSRAVGDTAAVAEFWGGELPPIERVQLSRTGCTPDDCPPDVATTVTDTATIDRIVELLLAGDRAVRSTQPGNIGATTRLGVTLELAGGQPPLELSISAEYAWLNQVDAVVPLALVDLVTDELGIERLTAGVTRSCPPTPRAMRAADIVTVFGRDYLYAEETLPLADAGLPIGLTTCRTEGYEESYMFQDLDATQLPVGSELVRILDVDASEAIAVVTEAELRIYRAVDE